MGVCCGVDIVEVSRIRQSLENGGEAFKNRVFTEKEIEYCESKKSAKYQSYAARFAAKEAVSKAFGTGIGQYISWKDIEVVNDEKGKPNVVLSDKAKELFYSINGVDISISLSHCNDYAVAYVVFELQK
ncbi:MAG TPA: holo-ACP synthase [Clostridiaceae bacterium]|nr:holo-ACP synthase [Clostridiaceae bacterium]